MARAKSYLLLLDLELKLIVNHLVIITVLEFSGNNIPYRMKIYTEFNLGTWFRLDKLTVSNISEF